MRSALAICLALLLAIAALAGSAAARPGATRATLRIAPEWRVPDALWIPVLVARDRGFYRAVGLDVQVVLPSASSSTTALVGGGGAEVGFATTPELVYARRAGRPVVSIANLTAHNNWGIYALSGKTVDAPGLQGKRIAVDGGIWSTIMLPYVLESAGLELADVQQVPSPAGVIPALIDKRSELAADVTNFGGAEARYRTGRTPSFLPGTAAGAPDIPVWTYLANGTWLTRDPASAKAWLAATSAATRWAVAHPAQAVAILEAAYPGTRHLHRLNLLAWSATIPLLGPLRQHDEQWSELTAAMIKSQQLRRAQPPRSYFTNRYLPRVKRQP